MKANINLVLLTPYYMQPRAVFALARSSTLDLMLMSYELSASANRMTASISARKEEMAFGSSSGGAWSGSHKSLRMGMVKEWVHFKSWWAERTRVLN